MRNGKLGCFIIGQENLLIHCAQELLDRGHEVYGVISSTERVSLWAEERNIPHIGMKDDIIAFLRRNPFDYLFSIVNDYILKDDILRLPRKFAINYHDSLLPTYAGSYAPAWAIMQQKIMHGITWHIASNEVDAGDILKQYPVDIAPDDTTFTLNIKCFSAALRAFSELLDEIESGCVSARKQSLQNRTFFPRNKRPSSACIISWDQPAHDIEAFVRALNFGPSIHHLGLPKFVLKGEFFLLNKIRVLSTTLAGLLPGTIIAIKDDAIVVSTHNNAIEICELSTTDGVVQTLSDFVKKFALYEGYHIPALESHTRNVITNYSMLINKQEAFWLKRLELFQPMVLSTFTHISTTGKSQYMMRPISIADAIINHREKSYPTWSIDTILIAAYLAYLARVEDNLRFDVGFKTVDQPDDVRELNTLFASYVPFHVEIHPAQSFEALFSAIHDEIEEMRKHKTFAHDIVAKYPALRSTVPLSVEQRCSIFIALVEKIDDFTPIAGSDLTLVVVRNTAESFFAYCADTIDEESATSIFQQFSTFLSNCILSREQSCLRIPLLTLKEFQKIVVDWNNTTTPYPQEFCIHEVFEAQVQQIPDAVAVIWEQEQVTYRELNQKANQVGQYLRTLGVGPDVLVGICVERSLEMVIGVLGILKAGGAYLPLDPSYPAERLAFMRKDAQVRVLLIQHHLQVQIPVEQEQVVYLDADWPQIRHSSCENVPRQESKLDTENLAYAIYTSGSTGNPKGVVITHAGVANLITAQKRTFVIHAQSRVLQFAAFGFDAWGFETFMALLQGATLCLCQQETLLSGKALLHYLTIQAITIVVLPPSLLAVLPSAELPALATIIVAGEACSAQVVARWAKGHQFFNAYGLTEATVWNTVAACTPETFQPPIGRPIINTQIYILDKYLAPVPIGGIGELYIGGAGLARNYLNHPTLTAERFIPHPFSTQAGTRLYKTGDLAVYRSDGRIEYGGRIGHQVKLRGFRIELEEIEHILNQHPEVQQSVVILREDMPGDKRLVGYIIPQRKALKDPFFEEVLFSQGLAQEKDRQSAFALSVAELHIFLRKRLPEYMIPSTFVMLDTLPLTPNGKVNRRSLPQPQNLRRAAGMEYVAPQTAIERIIVTIWQDLLHVDHIGLHDNFFDLGGNSLSLLQVQDRLQEEVKVDLLPLELFKYPTVHSLALSIDPRQQTHFHGPKRERTLESEAQKGRTETTDEIAIIGMAGQFPQAPTIDIFWENLRNGVESISFFTEEELLSEKVDPAVLRDPNYVRAGSFLDDIESFDASFFGYSPDEAQTIDPQQRLFLECASQGLEDAGYDPSTYQGSIGVYAGLGMNAYLLSHLQQNHPATNMVKNWQFTIGNGNDFLTTRVSYKLNLCGPSITVQTACSTSLVAIHMACESLRTNKCSMVLAGGVSLQFPRKVGYLYQEGGIASPDGHCRAFDAQARGTIIGEGVGIVVLKRLQDALADGDTIHAVIKGSAVNNDGSRKVGYTAPSIIGQAQVIQAAHLQADVLPETISYVEAHGTGTSLGDPIEIAALIQAFGKQELPKGFCAIGSVKTNIGHLDAAAGVAGLIKTVLALKHQELPPSLHFTHPNPQIDFANSPFYVNATLSPWKRTQGHPRRAGVSSFGIGGTNAHLLLEEAPYSMPQNTTAKSSWHVLPLSAKSHAALKRQTTNLLAHLQKYPKLDLANVAYTLQVGRRGFPYRQMVVCQNLPDAITVLKTTDSARLFTAMQNESARSVAFLFPGQGSQYGKMAFGLYQQYPLFRELLDHCVLLLKPHLGLDLRNILLFKEEITNELTIFNQQLEQTWLTQPALFVVEYALARLWMSWGVYPETMIGHSIGEYVAACLAGVFSLEEALTMVAARGRLMQSVPDGAMLAVSHPSQAIQALLEPPLALAAINAPMQCVVSGPSKLIEAFRQLLDANKIPSRRLSTSHAFHSSMMDPILDTFAVQMSRVHLKKPQMPFLSNVTGTWMTAEQATDPNYWVSQLRQTVRFADGLQTLLQHSPQVLLEVGPGHVLSTFAQQQIQKQGDATLKPITLSSLPSANKQLSESMFLLNTLGQLWLAGITINWSELYRQERPCRIPLPTYSFERQRYTMSARKSLDNAYPQPMTTEKRSDMTDWFSIPSWKRSIPPQMVDLREIKQPKENWLVFSTDTSEFEGNGLESQLIKTLQRAGQNVKIVLIGNQFTRVNEHLYILNPQRREDYDILFESIYAENQFPQKILYLWSITPAVTSCHAASILSPTLETALYYNFYSLVFLAQAFENYGETHLLHLWVVSNNMQKVAGETILYPEKATLLGPCNVIPQEFSHITCSSIDIILPPQNTFMEQKLVDQLVSEFFCDHREKLPVPVIAYRGDERWIQSVEAARLERNREHSPRLRTRGVYLITGGLGGIGLTFAKYLAQSVKAKLILIGRSAFPTRKEWDMWLTTHDHTNRISHQITHLQNLESLGAEVLVLSADVANQEQLQTAISTGEKHFGPIQGVIHAAGIAERGLIGLKTQEGAEHVLAPKIKGTLMLESILKDNNIDFFVLCSSLASLMGEIGQVDYCAANAFLDAFANYNTSIRGRLTIGINWDTWQEVGMTVNTLASLNSDKPDKMQIEYGLSPSEGCEAFHRILHHRLPQVFVSTQDLNNRFEASLKEREKQRASSAYESLNRTTTHIAPRNEDEYRLCKIWQEILGIDQIGIQDNFYDLGGDSLMSIQFIALAKAAGFSFTNSQVSDYLTIEELARIAENSQC